ncbi:hypothetical protein QN375_24285 [Pseudomonas sp. MH9.2]|jgi:intracellular sulfur oxidation DsrE/DsrF family protein|uniref:DsrE family protein n=1 Tax=unclassified Pseudomonas TaxID=196821 RepID=UPI002AC8FA28|nr:MULTISPECIES: hypothetical protein [unclassified Pseudomonas]MEB0028849.1 hypothetical protein [Pseudomonas sp. MH9.2]MEE3508339.1 hypothetical protein [Pseudomonas sp. 10C3]WPX68570.1 hypothetical protein RHM55_23030 [Pseudomonas sp. MH9.2]
MDLSEIDNLHVVLHAPTPDALARARNNAVNLLKDAPQATVRIIVNSKAVAAALDDPNGEMDAITWICPNTLRSLDRDVSAPLRVLAQGAVSELVKMQSEGWFYIRA